jgi:hypothetical protein
MNEIPLKPVTYKTVNRFPALYKIQAQQAIRYEVREAIRTTCDSVVMAAMIALVEEFDFGTNERSTKLLRFKKALQEIIDTNSDFYSDAVAEGLKNRLHNLGVDYKGD